MQQLVSRIWLRFFLNAQIIGTFAALSQVALVLPAPYSNILAAYIAATATVIHLLPTSPAEDGDGDGLVDNAAPPASQPPTSQLPAFGASGINVPPFPPPTMQRPQ